jgi:L-alanine-DL-glutamate epimerase-like enolase superfamily enzyme
MDAAQEWKIGEVRTWRTVLRRAVPWKTARYTKGDIEATIVGISDESGVMGYGYVPAMLLEGESAPSAEALLHGVLKPLIKRKDLVGIQPLLMEMDLALAHNLQVKFAVEEALLDLQAKRLHTPVYNLLGGLCRREVPVMRMLGIKTPKETAEEARSMVERGYTHIKLKVGLDEKRDIETMRIVRETVGEAIFISADANRSYTPMQAIRVINQLEKWRLDAIEQPVRADDIRGMAFVRQHIHIPLMADEGVLTSADALRFVEAGALEGRRVYEGQGDRLGLQCSQCQLPYRKHRRKPAHGGRPAPFCRIHTEPDGWCRDRGVRGTVGRSCLGSCDNQWMSQSP